MEQTTEDASWTLVGLLMPANIFIRCISFACLGLGLIVSLPFAFLIVLDFFLWIWRIYWSRYPSKKTAPNGDRAAATTPSTGANGTEHCKAE